MEEKRDAAGLIGGAWVVVVALVLGQRRATSGRRGRNGRKQIGFIFLFLF